MEDRRYPVEGGKRKDVGEKEKEENPQKSNDLERENDDTSWMEVEEEVVFLA